MLVLYNNETKGVLEKKLVRKLGGGGGGSRGLIFIRNETCLLSLSQNYTPNYIFD